MDAKRLPEIPACLALLLLLVAVAAALLHSSERKQQPTEVVRAEAPSETNPVSAGWPAGAAKGARSVLTLSCEGQRVRPPWEAKTPRAAHLNRTSMATSFHHSPRGAMAQRAPTALQSNILKGPSFADVVIQEM